MAAQDASAQAFEAAKMAFKKDLADDKLFNELLQTTSIDKVWAATQDIQAKQDSQQRLRHMRKIKTFLDRLQAYAATVDTFVQVKPDIMAIIWGGIRLLLVWTSNIAKHADAVITAMEKIGDFLPKFTELGTAFHNKECVQKILTLFYQDILDFQVAMLKFFKMKRLQFVFDAFWPRQREKLDVIVINIERHVALMHDEVTHIHIIEEHKHRIQALEHFERETETQRHQQLQALRAIIAPRLYDDTLDWLLNRSCDGSAQPLLDNADFGRWLDASDQDMRSLWLHGIPGAGKTFLSAIAINQVRARGYRTSFAFISHSDQGLTARTILQSLLFQVVGDDQDACAVLVRSGEQELRGTTTQISKLLEEVLLQGQGGKPIYMIVDGLDEMEAKERRILLMQLTDLLDACPEVKMLVSSRPEDDIVGVLKKATGIRVDKENSGSIQAYVEQRLKTWMDESGFDQHVRENIRMLCASVPYRANGMFLYARIVLDNASQFSEPSEIERELTVLPRDLDDAYHRVFSRIRDLRPAALQKKAIRILGWISCSPTPLTQHEIDQALLMDPDADSELSVEKRAPSVVNGVNFVRICGPIIEIVDESLRFVHFTVKEYILSHEIPGSINEGEARYSLAKVALSYLCSGLFDPHLSNEQIKEYILSGRYCLSWFAVAQWVSLVTRCLSRPRDISAYSDLMEYLTHLSLGLRNYSFKQTVAEMVERTIQFRRDDRRADWTYENSDDWVNVDPLVLSHMTARVAHLLNKLVCVRHEVNKKKEQECHFAELHRHYGRNLFKCKFVGCEHNRRGLDTRSARDQHEQGHGRPFKCSVAGCPYTVIGFDTRHRSWEHWDTRHSKADEQHSALTLSGTALPSDSYSNRIPTRDQIMAILHETTKTGNVNEVESCMLRWLDRIRPCKRWIIEPSMHLAARMGSRPLMEALTFLFEDKMEALSNYRDDRSLVNAIMQSGSADLVRWLLEVLAGNYGDRWKILSSQAMATDIPDVYTAWEDAVVDPTPPKRRTERRPNYCDDSERSDQECDGTWKHFKPASTNIPLWKKRQVLFSRRAYNAVKKSPAHEVRLMQTWARLAAVLGQPLDPRLLGWSLTCLARYTSKPSCELAADLLRLGAPIDFPNGVATIHYDNASGDDDAVFDSRGNKLRNLHTGKTALHYVAMHTSEQAIRLARFLLERGADPELGIGERKPGDEPGAQLMGEVLGESWDDVVARTAPKREERKTQETTEVTGVGAEDSGDQRIKGTKKRRRLN